MKSVDPFLLLLPRIDLSSSEIYDLDSTVQNTCIWYVDDKSGC